MISVHSGGGMQGAVLGFCGGGDITMDDELEEGEYNKPYRADDNFDPDEHSYIDVKLSRVLGHAQRDFLSGAPLENLGPMTGGYGSFMPSYARSPLLVPPRCRNNLPLEVVNQSGSVPPSKMLGITSSSVVALLAPKAASMDTTTNGDLCLLSSQGHVEFNPELPNGKKSVNPIEQKAHLVPVKVDSERNLSQINARIYSGLGLDESPTSSEEGSPVDNKGLSPESEAEFDHLLCLIKEMVSFPIPDGSLLSPLPEHMLCLVERVMLPNESLPGLAREGSNLKSSSRLVQECTDWSNGKSGENKIKSVERTSKELNNVHIMHAANGIIPHLKGKDTESCKEKVSESVSKHNAARVESWNSKTTSAEKLPEDRKGSPHRDVQLNRNKDMAKKGDQRYEKYHAEPNGVKDRKVLSGGSADSLIRKVGQEALAIEKDGLKRSNRKEQPASEGKVKQKESQCNIASATEFVKGRFSIDSSTVTESKKKSSENNPSKGNLGNNKLRKESSKTRDPIRGMEGAVKTGGNIIGNGPKESPLHTVGKEIQALATKQKGILDVKNSSKASMSQANPVAAPVVGSLTGNTAPSNAAPAVVNPVVINENWVCCDRCGRWRLLPFGTDAEHLQRKKWLCSMLDWLPGMNRCDISEEETTRALYALFQIPMPESQNNLQGVSAPESNLVDGHHFRQTHQQPAMPNVEKKPERRDTYDPDKTDLLIPARKQLQTPGDAKHSKTNSKRWVDDDGSQPSKKLKAENLYGANGEWNTDNGQIMGKVSSGLNNHPAKELAKDAQKRSKHSSSKDLKSDSKDRVSISLKNPKDQFSFDSRAMDTGKSDEIGGSAKKRKFNEWQENQIYSPGGDPSNAKASGKLTGEIKVNKEKKAKVSKSDLKGSSTSNGSAKSDRKGRVIRVPVASSPTRNRTAERVSGSIQKDQQPGFYGYASTGCQQTVGGIDTLKKDSAAATSSSSKVSGSRKGKPNFQEAKGSPVESVSSSPLRIPNVGKAVAAKRNPMGENDITDASFSSMSSPRRCLDGGSHQPGTARKEKDASAIQHKSLEPFGDDNQQRDANCTGGKVAASIERSSGSESNHRCADIIDQRSSEVQGGEHGQRVRLNGSHYQSSGSLPAKGSYLHSKGRHLSSTSVPDKSNAKVPCSFSEQEELPSAKNLRYEREIGSHQHKELRDSKYSLKGPVKCSKEDKSHLGKEDSASKRSGDSVRAVQSKSGRVEGSDVKGVASCSKNGKTNGPVSRNLDDPNAVRKDSSVQAADSAIKEAKNLKHKADRLKNAISELEFIGLYFQAALKFLYGASLSEPSNYDNSKHIEMTRSMQLYGETAKLCEFVAQQYERHKEMASAALAYKCMEVAYMRIIYSTNPIMKKDWLDLQMALPPLGESPSSSASDVDNANNQIMMGKGAAAKGLPASHIAGNHLILTHNRASFARLLNQVQDVFRGMEASRNAQNAFAAATLGWQDKKHAEGISSVKRVVDYNFHDVEGLLRLVRLAMEAISR